jgi:hypothetical protein
MRLSMPNNFGGRISPGNFSSAIAASAVPI